MRNSLMVLGYVIFAFGGISLVLYLSYHWTNFDLGIALASGALALIGLIAQMAAIDIRKLQRRIEALERIDRLPLARDAGTDTV